LAKPSDIVLIAGKGHEKCRSPRKAAAIRDVEVARKALLASGYAEDFGQALTERWPLA